MPSTNANWPLTVTQFSTSVPFDGSTPSWHDISIRVRDMRSSSGRQYELDTIQTGEATFTVDDEDESLNPTNTSSPYYPNIQPYRRLIDQAMWPPSPVGGAVNLLNSSVRSNAALGTGSAGYDPTFESYSTGSTPAWITAVGGTSPTVQAANPQQGSNSLQWSVTSSSTQQGVSYVVPCIPGQQYTASAYIRQTSASTQQISISGGAAGTSTTTTGSYVRLSVTFTATQPTHVVQVITTGTAVAGTVNLDAVQHEPGASASTFASTGPVIYTPFAGYVERWPVNWKYQGMFGSSSLTCVDALGTLTASLHTEYRTAVLGLKPAYYWTLGEPSTAADFGEISGNGGPAMKQATASAGAWDTFTAGTTTNIAGDPSGTGLSISNSTNATSAQSVARGGTPSVGQRLSFAPAANTGYSVAFWAAHSSWGSGIGAFMFGAGDYRALAVGVQVDTSTPANIVATAQMPNLGDTFQVTVPDSYADGKLHLYVITATTSPSEAMTLYIDGVSYAGSNTLFTFQVPNVLYYVDVGGSLDPNTNTTTPVYGNWGSLQGAKGGVYAHVALWNRALSSSEVASLWTAAGGNVGETSGARISRYLSYANYTGTTSIDTGLSTMGASTLTEGQALIDACQQVALSENGIFYVDNGVLTFRGRTDRYFKTTATWVFGERTDLGELPYEADIAFDYDPTLVINDVKITRSGGLTAAATDQTSQNSYLRHSYTRTINVQSDNEAVDCADYLLARGKQPAQRVSRLTINPAANPSLWPVALGARISDRVTVKRRTSAGYTMSADYFIERIEHNRNAGAWTVSFQMSPAVTSTFWVLQDSVNGVLDTTTVPAY